MRDGKALELQQSKLHGWILSFPDVSQDGWPVRSFPHAHGQHSQVAITCEAIGVSPSGMPTTRQRFVISKRFGVFGELFSRTVVLRYRIHLEQKNLAPPFLLLVTIFV